MVSARFLHMFFFVINKYLRKILQDYGNILFFIILLSTHFSTLWCCLQELLLRCLRTDDNLFSSFCSNVSKVFSFPPLISVQLSIYIRRGSCRSILFYRLNFNTIVIYFVVQIPSALATGRPFKWVTGFLCPFYRIPASFYWRMIFRYQDLGTRCIQCYWVSFS